MKTAQKIESKLNEYGIKIKCRYLGLQNWPGQQTENQVDQADKWLFSAWRGDSHQEFDFYTGLGHRDKLDYLQVRDVKNRKWLPINEPNRIDSVELARINNPFNRLTVHDTGKYRLQMVKIPTCADLLNALFMEMGAGEMDFVDWCDEIGGNPDSIKDKETYEACQKNAFKLKKIFSGDQIIELSELLQDY